MKKKLIGVQCHAEKLVASEKLVTSELGDCDKNWLMTMKSLLSHDGCQFDGSLG